jgi:hypothetical protein
MLRVHNHGLGFMATLTIVAGNGEVLWRKWPKKIINHVYDDVQIACLPIGMTTGASVVLLVPLLDEEFVVVELPLKELQMAVDVFVKEMEQAIEH